LKYCVHDVDQIRFADAATSTYLVIDSGPPRFDLRAWRWRLSSHHWMRRWRDLLESIGTVWAFDYPYMVEGESPDPLPKLIAAHCEALALARQAHQARQS
jgi:hypothetical protein